MGLEDDILNLPVTLHFSSPEVEETEIGKRRGYKSFCFVHNNITIKEFVELKIWVM